MVLKKVDTNIRKGAHTADTWKFEVTAYKTLPQQVRGCSGTLHGQCLREPYSSLDGKQ